MPAPQLGDAHALNQALAAGQITYQQYADAMGMGAPPAPPPPPPPAQAPYVESGPDQGWADQYGARPIGFTGGQASLADARAQAEIERQNDAADAARHAEFMRQTYGAGTARGGPAAPKPKAKPLSPDALSTASTEGSAEAQGGEAAYRPPPTYRIPAHETPTVDPKRIATIDAAQQGEIGAQAELGQAQVHQEQAIGEAARAHREELEGQSDDLMRAAEEHQSEIKRREGALEGLSRELASKTYKEDPDRWWKSRTTHQRMLYGIAAFFAGFANPGGQNQILAQMQHNADMDLESQRADIERAQKGGRQRLEDMRGGLVDAYKRFGNMDQAMAAAQALSLQQIDDLQKEHAVASNSEAVLAQSKLMTERLKEGAAEKLASLYKYSPASVGGGAPDLTKRYQAYVEGQLAKPGGKAMTYPEFVRSMLGAGGASLATSPSAGRGGKPNANIADQVAVAEQAIANVNALRDENGDLPGTGVVSRNLPPNSAMRGTEARQLHGALMTLAEAAAHANSQRGTEAVKMNYDMIVGNGSKEDIDAGIDRARRIIQSRASSVGTAGEEPSGKVDYTDVEDEGEGK